MRAQTDFYEYHWAHLMQGNRLRDLFPTVRRLLFTRWRNVPYGITWLWVMCWLGAVILFNLIVSGNLDRPPGALPGEESEILVRVGYGVVAIPTAFVVGAVFSLLSRNLASSFVDVTRYLDTSPRSYAVRREIRQGFVKLLEELHEDTIGDTDERGHYRYRRIVVVAHSLGAFIAYDGISSLWGRHPAQLPAAVRQNRRTSGVAPPPARNHGDPGATGALYANLNIAPTISGRAVRVVGSTGASTDPDGSGTRDDQTKNGRLPTIRRRGRRPSPTSGCWSIRKHSADCGTS